MARHYMAFMSYSHAADGKLAPALQSGIQRLGKPWYRRPAIRVFRDETSLSANPSLWSGIQSALEQSQYFLLMASAQSAASPWVRREIEWWLAHRSASRLLIVVTEGDLVWDTARQDFDWERTSCLPALLRGHFREEPHFVDLRWAMGRSDTSLRNTRFRSAVLKLAAVLHGQPMDELDGEDLRQQRRLRTIAGLAMIVLAALAVFSIMERQAAQQQGRSALEQRRMAESRSMAAKSVEILAQKGSVDQAILLAVLAWRLSPTDEARSALAKLEVAAADIARITGQSAGGGVDALAFRPVKGEPALLATGDGFGVTLLWRVPGGETAGPPIAGKQTSVDALIFSADGSHLLTRAPGAPTPEEPNHQTLELHDLNSGARRVVPTAASRNGRPISWSLEETTALSPDGRLVAFGSGTEMAMWDSATGALRYRTVPGQIIGLHFVTNSKLVFVKEQGDMPVGFRRGWWDRFGCNSPRADCCATGVARV